MLFFVQGAWRCQKGGKAIEQFRLFYFINMKNFYLKSILMCLSLFVCMTASAYVFNAGFIDGVYYNLNTTDNTASVTCLYKNNRNASAYRGKVVIPSSIYYSGDIFSVTSIDRYAFQYCSGLTSITIPPSIEIIEGQAFYGCDGLSAVHITDLEAWCNISFSNASGNPLFYAHHLYLNGKEVKDLIIPEGITSIGTEAFAGGSGFTSITIPSSVTSIGDVAFEQCSNLSSVSIPSSVISIGWSPFADCSNIASIVVQEGNPAYDSRDNCNAIIETATNTLIMGCNQTIIPEDIIYIAKGALYGYNSIKSMNIPNNVEVIGDWAFSFCNNMASLVIPNSVTSIGEYAFYGCEGLADIYCYAESVPETDSYVFDYIEKKYVILHVPASSIKEYKSTSPWNSFGKIVALTDEETDVNALDVTTKCANPVDYYNIDGQKGLIPQQGVNIIQMSDGTTKKVLINRRQ